VATALMATGRAIDVDRRSLPLLLGRCFFPKCDATTWGINSAGPGQVESGFAHEDQDASPASFAFQQVARISLRSSGLRWLPRSLARFGDTASTALHPAANFETIGGGAGGRAR
jgi:hypothetical protein